MRARNPSNSKASNSTVKKSLDQEKLSRYVYRLCVQEATISTTIFTRMFRQEPSSQSKRAGNLKARGGEKNPNHLQRNNSTLSSRLSKASYRLDWNIISGSVSV